MSDAGAPKLLPAGDRALTVEFGDTIDAALNDRVAALDAALAVARLDGVIETTPTYRSLTIHYDPERVSFAALGASARALAAATPAPRPPRRWIAPACYDPALAEDLNETAAALGLPPREVAARHAGAVYRVFMYGFAPGFLFLGGLPDALTISRRPSPRPPIPRGALLIAGGQALIASLPMPTGWRMIGRTPARVFDAGRTPMAQAGVGDEITFEPIDAARFAALDAEGVGLRLATP
ncbi:allophanate hydrolase subunit 1 [Methylocella sp.]|uniref:allophanate hydrolase subunit 1 n=1 Tax=Methylocella sp. TaxID=1978226 RepID=UPI003784CB08